jgi:hypothetical protein
VRRGPGTITAGLVGGALLAAVLLAGCTAASPAEDPSPAVAGGDRTATVTTDRSTTAPLPADGSGATATRPDARPDARAATRSGTGEVRHDLDPLAARLPALTGALDATWASGTLGDASVPGPSLYWIDAVVTLPATTAADLRGSLDLAPLAERPPVADPVADAVPTGTLLGGPDLDAALSADGWQVTAALAADTDVLVLVITGT